MSRPAWDITTYKTDQYGRWLVDIQWNETSTINQMMVGSGFASFYPPGAF